MPPFAAPYNLSDPLSDVLAVLRPSNYMFRAIDARGDWSLAFPGLDGIRCYALQVGAVLFQLEGESSPRELRAGNCLVLTGRQSLKMFSRLDLASEDAVAVLTSAPWGGVVTLNGGGEIYGLGGFFLFEDRHAIELLQALPDVMHLDEQTEGAALRAAMDVVMSELREPRPGGRLVAQQTALSILVLLMRQQLACGGQAGPGWLQGLGDPKISRALQAIHADPAHGWDLVSLAKQAGMSRSALALHFRNTVGEPPMAYLQRWRLTLASDRLLHGQDRIGDIAAGVGYMSESAFCSVFKKAMGCSPRAYRRHGATAVAHDR